MARIRYFVNYGLELEGFLTTHKDGVTNIHCARNILFDHFKHSDVKLKMGDYTIFNDGTPLEITSGIFFAHYMASGAIKFMWDKLSKFIFMLGCEPSFKAFYVNGPKVKFINPSYTFSSEKVHYNAYTGNYFTAIKKEQDVVTLRTIGLHIHIGFPEEFSKLIFAEIPKVDYDERVAEEKVERPHKNIHCNEIIKLIDLIFEEQLSKLMSQAERRREEEYSTPGDFRIKTDTITGLPTLEYRRLSSEFAMLPRVFQDRFFKEIDEKIINYLKETF